MAGLGEEFAKRNTKILGLSVDSSEDKRDWLPDIEEVSGNKVDYPVVGDSDLKVAKLYNMLPADETGNAGGRTAANNATVRTVYIIGPDKKIRAMLLYPMSSGRNFDEVLRRLDSVQLTESKGVATPVNWQKGDDVIIPPSLSDEDAKAKYPAGWDTKKSYLRVIPQPTD